MRRFSLAVLCSLAFSLTLLAGDFTPTRTPTLDGVRATVDLPASQQMRNTGGSDGSGLCVFTSLQHAARWANLIDLDGYRRWMESRPGGGWPQKVDQTLAAYCRQKGVELPDYVQHTGGNAAFLDLAIKTGRCPCVTYAGMDDFYRGGVDHMVNLAALTDTEAAIIDNNRPGYWVWMSRPDFLNRWKARGGGWAVVFLAPPPPPYNATPAAGPKSTTCDCGATGKCRCWEGECRCLACGRRGIEQCPNCPNDPNCPDGRCPLTRPANPLFGPAAPTGVVPGRVHDHPTYSRRGREVTEAEANGALLDDSGRWHLSAVGDPAFLARVKADVAKLSDATRAKLHVQLYAPAAWQVSQFKLSAGVTIRKPSAGRVSSDLGAVPPGDYSAAKLADLIGLPDGPDPKPLPPAPPPSAPPAPPPAQPDTSPDLTGGVKPCGVALLAAWLLMRRRATK